MEFRVIHMQVGVFLAIFIAAGAYGATSSDLVSDQIDPKTEECF